MAFRSLLPVAFRGAVASVVSSRLHSGRTAANAKAFAAVATLASTERDGWSSWRPFAEAAGFAAAAVTVAGLTAPQAGCAGQRKWGHKREGSLVPFYTEVDAEWIEVADAPGNNKRKRCAKCQLEVTGKFTILDKVSDYNYVQPQIVWGDGVVEEEE